MEILDLQPKKVFKYFSEISKIPRCSGNEKEISDYLVNFGKERGFDVYQDEALNVYMKKKQAQVMKMHLQSFFKVTWIWFALKVKTLITTSVKIQ